MRTNLPIVDTEYPLAEGQSIVSCTDLQGNITYANPYFIEASGYSEEELIGAPQNILRHPDMPPSAFGDLWATIKAGKPWRALVKNRRKNGEYYWVFANVTPVIENGKAIGYMSVRTRPSRAEIDAASRLYRMEMDRPGSLKLRQGTVIGSSLLDMFGALLRLPFNTRVAITMLPILCASLLTGAAIAMPRLVADYGLNAWLLPLSAANIVAVLGCWIYLVVSMGNPLKSALRIIQRMAGGDLTSAVLTDRTDEIGQMLRTLNQLNTNLHSIVGDIRLNFGKMVMATEKIANGNRDLSTRTDSQAAALEETAASIEEITSAVKQNADNSVQGDKLASGALSTAEKGGAIVTKVVATIADISDSSRKMSDIVGIINSIAYQTNLLALNAAVEAARAGEAGRGFAVVATEVRSLAQRSAEAASQIKELIEGSVTRVEAGTVLAQDAGAAMKEVLDSIRNVTAIMTDISLASNEQSTGISQVNTAVVQLDETTQRNASLVEEAATSTQNLEQQGRKLMEALAVFKLGGGRDQAVGHEAAPVEAVTKIRRPSAIAAKRRAA